MPKQTSEVVKVYCHVAVDYVSSDRTYEVTKNKGDYHFRNLATGGGTYMRPWLYKRAIANGMLEEITA